MYRFFLFAIEWQPVYHEREESGGESTIDAKV